MCYWMAFVEIQGNGVYPENLKEITYGMFDQLVGRSSVTSFNLDSSNYVENYGQGWSDLQDRRDEYFLLSARSRRQRITKRNQKWFHQGKDF